jgi:protein-tyrosine phosphatase
MTDLLVVCRGNVYRSPTTEFLLRGGLRGTEGIGIASAGIAAEEGRPAAAAVIEFLRGRGIEAGDFRARRLDRAALRRAHLVVVMTRAQRAAVVGLEPTAVRRTFLLRQLTRLLTQHGADLPGRSPADRLSAVPDALARVRTTPPPPAGEDIEDPAGRPGTVVDVLTRIEREVGVLLGAMLAGAPVLRARPLVHAEADTRP